ncbi:MAG: sensor histidine kinase, partial [Alphaproteobacteria bacterium]
FAEQQAEADTRLTLALRSAGMGVWQSELGSGRLELDANIATMFGFGAAPITVSDADWIGRIHPDDRPSFVAALNARRIDKRPLDAEFRVVRPNRTVLWLAVQGSVVRHADDTAYRSVGVARDVTERRRAAERQRLLMDELNHRVRNSLATVLSLAEQTAANTASTKEFMPAFQARLLALAAAHNLLTRKSWEGVSLRELIETILAPDRETGPDRIGVAGPDCELTAQQALAMTLGLHEMATNARKYGALSSPEGKIAVGWKREGSGLDERVVLTWVERDGPPVAPPTRNGFGSRLLTRALAMDLDGSVALDFNPAGLRCTIGFRTGLNGPP